MRLKITVEFTKTLIKKKIIVGNRPDCRLKVAAFIKHGVLVKESGLESTLFPPSRIHEIRIKEIE